MTRIIDLLKRALPDRDMDLPILFGPFRGGAFHSNPRSSLRKVFGIYEHELNWWLRHVLPRIDRVIDVGANDGYFTFGSAAAMRRFGKPPNILAIEPSADHVRQLETAKRTAGLSDSAVNIVKAAAGNIAKPGMVVLDQLPADEDTSALIKIDVEGSEMDVIHGCGTWLTARNFFLIEVHRYGYIAALSEIFSSAGVKLMQIDQRRLPVLGREHRDAANWWLVSDIGR